MTRIEWQPDNVMIRVENLNGEPATAEQLEQVRLSYEFGRLVADIKTWQRVTFPDGDAAGCVEHLRREVVEVHGLFWTSPSLGFALEPGEVDTRRSVRHKHAPLLSNVAEELADCLLLVIATADRAGVDLLEGGRVKLAKNKLRKWTAPDAQGVIEHDRSGES